MTSENEIAFGILRIAALQENGVASYHRLRREIPNVVALDEFDCDESETRPGEPMWHQIMRNVQSHHESDDNYIARGLLEHVSRVGYRITSAGLRYLQSRTG